MKSHNPYKSVNVNNYRYIDRYKEILRRLQDESKEYVGIITSIDSLKQGGSLASYEYLFECNYLVIVPHLYGTLKVSITKEGIEFIKLMVKMDKL